MWITLAKLFGAKEREETVIQNGKMYRVTYVGKWKTKTEEVEHGGYTVGEAPEESVLRPKVRALFENAGPRKASENLTRKGEFI